MFKINGCYKIMTYTKIAEIVYKGQAFADSNFDELLTTLLYKIKI